MLEGMIGLEIVGVLILSWLLWREKRVGSRVITVVEYSVKSLVVNNRDRDFSNAQRHLAKLGWEWVSTMGSHYDKKVQMIFKQRYTVRIIATGT